MFWIVTDVFNNRDLRARVLQIKPTKQDTETLIIAVYVQLHESVDVQTISDKELLLFNARHVRSSIHTGCRDWVL
jgi:hypothetical protein